jgi:peptidoglycan DL-endopeptidase CwlO
MRLLLFGVFTCALGILGLPALMPATAAPDSAAAPVAIGGQHLPVAGAALAVGRIQRMDGLVPLFPGVPPGGFPHDTYTWGNCTWWVAFNRQVPGHLGDGWQWLGNAAAAGLRTSSQPALGAIVVYGRSPAYDPVHGHVAIVVGIGGGGITVSEMNFIDLNVVDERGSPWPDSRIEGFIV